LGGYLSKYLAKNLFEGKMFRKKKFFKSQGLFEPILLFEHYASLFVKKFLLWITPVFEKSFYSEYTGHVDYKCFLLGFLPYPNGFCSWRQLCGFS